MDDPLPEHLKEHIWKMPLVHFAAMMGVNLTPAQSILLGGWIRRHNQRILERCRELADAEARAQRDSISQN